jgi:hypothetical protein
MEFRLYTSEIVLSKTKIQKIIYVPFLVNVSLYFFQYFLSMIHNLTILLTQNYFPVVSTEKRKELHTEIYDSEQKSIEARQTMFFKGGNVRISELSIDETFSIPIKFKIGILRVASLGSSKLCNFNP